ncbi:P-II family nitrogen regulator [Haloferula sargassicola]|uniref:P-II family nitrogen regulator n=1 Tax=Haloferula sargassicola TaxID=490096 RepID=UPI0033652F2A
MKEIKAIIRDYLIDEVVDALEQLQDPPAITVSDVRGMGHTERSESSERFIRRGRLEIVVPADQADEIVRVIVERAHTGRNGDGIVFVSDVERAVRVRTGTEGHAALK